MSLCHLALFIVVPVVACLLLGLLDALVQDYVDWRRGER